MNRTNSNQSEKGVLFKPTVVLSRLFDPLLLPFLSTYSLYLLVIFYVTCTFPSSYFISRSLLYRSSEQRTNRLNAYMKRNTILFNKLFTDKIKNKS